MFVSIFFYTDRTSLSAAEADSIKSKDPSITRTARTFVGSQACKECHQPEYKNWQKSDHHHAFAEATKASVQGDFGDVEVDYTDGQAVFAQDSDGQFQITLHTPSGEQTYPVRYTLAHDPLQQYLLETEPGNFQVFALAWDTRPETQGGQRWIELQPGETASPDNPFHWKNYFQNWNSQCADCHTTHFEKNFLKATDKQSARFESTWAEAGVGCEACHGPASEHLDWANGESSADAKGLTKLLAKRSLWQFEASNAIASNLSRKTQGSAEIGESAAPGVAQASMNTCARCHSLRHPIGDQPFESVTVESGHNDFTDQFDLQLVAEPMYFRDGQIREEVFVYGSFLQSKMHNAGVTCSNCHDAHSAKVPQFDSKHPAKPENDAVCMQCHRADVFAVAKHHHHPVDSEAARCVSCHMPERTYMQIDPRRDHSFSVPSPALSELAGTPNVCTDCHSEQNDDWAAARIDGWRKPDTEPTQDFANWQLAAAKAQVSADPSLAIRVESERYRLLALANTPSMKKAMLIETMPVVDNESYQALVERLSDDHATVRQVAIDRLAAFPPDTRETLLWPMLDDPQTSVRLRATLALADTLQQLSQAKKQQLQQAVDEYIATYRRHEDLTASHLKMAALYRQLADYEQAAIAYGQALALVPNVVGTMANLADIYRLLKRDQEGEQLLLAAIEAAKDNAAFFDDPEQAQSAQLQHATVEYALGLLYIRTKEQPYALKRFQTAVELDPQNSQYFYANLLTLDALGRRSEALVQLKSSALTRQSEQLQQLLSNWQAPRQ